MLTLVNISSSDTSAVETATLIADYAAFDRQRTARRQYMKAFGGMAIVVLFGAAFNYVPRGQALIVAGLLVLLPLSLGVVEAAHWFRLVRRLDRVRAEVHTPKKS
jgi:hypothetical protein